MARQKPPNPVGFVSDFPYQVFWEEFGELWENLELGYGGLKQFESLTSRAASARGAPPHRVTKDAIYEALDPLSLEPQRREDLSDKLYGLAAAYLTPRLRKELRHSPKQTEKRLRRLAATAKELLAILEPFDLELEAVLDVLKMRLDARESSNSYFNFKILIQELRDLSRVAETFADEMPKWQRGTTVNVLRRRWIRTATRALDDIASEPVEVLQSDTAGRNPRPKNVTAKVLFEYLELVDPTVSHRAVVEEVLALGAPMRRLLKAMPIRYDAPNI